MNSTKSPELIIAMHHRSLPVGSTDLILERHALVTGLSESTAVEITAIEDTIREASLSSFTGKVVALHTLRAQQRQTSRALNVLAREIRKREERGVPLSG